MRFRLIIVLSLIACLLTSFKTQKESPEAYDRDRVVLLKSPLGSCTGVEVRAPSGTVYTLTARHCKDLIQNGSILAVTEDGKKHVLNYLATDDKSDLMILQGIPDKSTEVAKSVDRHQKGHTMTHGEGMPSYRTEGEMLEETDLKVLMFPILSKEDESKCTAIPKTSMIDTGLFTACVATLHLMLTTAWVLPGSSGGPMFNDKEELIGIVSCSGGDGFSGMVTLKDIQNFLKNR